MTEPTLQQLASEQQSQANFLEELASSLRALQSAREQERLQALLSTDTPLRMGAYPAGADVYPAGTTDPGATNIIADGSVTSSTIADGAVTLTALASGLKPPLVVSVLPSLPDSTNYPAGGGQLVFLTTTQLLYKTIDGTTWVKAVDGADITANSITAGQVAAGGLAAEIVLASIFKTAASGTRIEFDTNGLRAYNGSTLIVNIPTDGSNVYIAAAIDASSINVTGNATLQGSGNVLSAGSTTTLGNGVATPASAPSLAQDWATGISPAYGASYTPAWVMEYTASGGAGGATKVIYTIANGPSGHYYLLEFLASDGSLNRSLDLGTSAPFGVAFLSGSLYILFTGGGVGLLVVKKYAVSTLTLTTTYSSVSAPVNNTNPCVIASDGTNIYILQQNSGVGSPKFNKYDSAMVKVGSTITTTLADTDYFDLKAGNFDFGAFRLVASAPTAREARPCDSTGAAQANEVFPVPTGNGIAYGDVDGTGATFWSLNGTSPLVKHSTWTWTTASSIYWVAYSWYDSAGTTHETQCGPRASITMGRRKRLTVSTPTIPGAGGADDPNNHRIYMLPNATDPGLTALKLQDTSADATTVLTTYNAAGAADPGSNSFPSGTPAQLQTASGGWALKGNGLVNRTGTSFPASPATNDTYFRSDLGMEFFFDGTRWLSTTRYAMTSSFTSVDAFTTTSYGDMMAAPILDGCSDVWLERVECAFYVYTGTALGASHKWVGSVQKNVAGSATSTTIATFTIDSGASAQWRQATAVDINALLHNGTTHAGFQTQWARTGTPGNLQESVTISYRLVAV